MWYQTCQQARDKKAEKEHLKLYGNFRFSVKKKRQDGDGEIADLNFITAVHKPMAYFKAKAT